MTQPNRSYYKYRGKYPWLTTSFIDRARYQVSRAMLEAELITPLNLTTVTRRPFTKILFGNNGAKNLQVIYNGSVYNLDKIKADPFEFAMILESIFTESCA